MSAIWKYNTVAENQLQKLPLRSSGKQPFFQRTLVVTRTPQPPTTILLQVLAPQTSNDRSPSVTCLPPFHEGPKGEILGATFTRINQYACRKRVLRKIPHDALTDMGKIWAPNIQWLAPVYQTFRSNTWYVISPSPETMYLRQVHNNYLNGAAAHSLA